MFEKLKVILDIQELDMKMIRLMRVKKERQKELNQIDSLREDLSTQLTDKKAEITELEKTILDKESKIQDTLERIKNLEGKQSTVKKVDEFNALTQEMTQAEREKITNEQQTSDLIDKKNLEQEILVKVKESLKESEQSSKTLEEEIRSSIKMINGEGKELKGRRDIMAKDANGEILHVYERLLKNKKDRVIVPLENRTCSGCHIALTAQHENLVRKGERIVFCEHCSRIHFWQESEATLGTTVATKRRRRKLQNT